MNDSKRVPAIAARLGVLRGITDAVDDLRCQLDEERAITHGLRQERHSLRAANALLSGQVAGLEHRLAAALERERTLREHRRISTWGAVCALWWRLTKRED